MAGIDANTKLMLHCNGGSGSTDFVDASPATHGTATVGGTAHVDGTTKKFGTGSLKLDGDSDYIFYLDHADWDLVGNNADNWTIDLQIKHADHAANESYLNQYEDGNNQWFMWHVHTLGMFCKSFHNTGVASIDLDGGEMEDTNWHHIAICKVGNKYGAYKDGTQVSYCQTNDTDTFAGPLYIGTKETTVNFFDGHLDEIRIQHSNYFEANPATTGSGLDDTITPPTGEYSAGIEHEKTFTDTIDITSTHALALTIRKSFSESIGVSDQKVSIFQKVLIDSIDTSDIFTYRENPIEVKYLTSATATFLNLQSGLARPYWEVNYTVSGTASTNSGIIGQTYRANDILSMGTIDREKPVAISGLSTIFAGNVTLALNNVSGTYSPRATASIFTDEAGSTLDYMHSIINTWAGFMDTSGTAYVIQRGSFLLSKLRIDSEKRLAYIECEDIARIPLKNYVGLPEDDGTATIWTPPSGYNTKAIMTELLSAVGLVSSQYSLASGIDFQNYAITETVVGDALAELAQANDGYIYTNGKGQIVFALNTPLFGGRTNALDLKDSTRITTLRYSIDIKNLINKVTIKYTSGADQSRSAEDTNVTKGRAQIITNETIDRPAIAEALCSRLLTQFGDYREFLEQGNIWLPSLEIGNSIALYDANTYTVGESFQIYRIREDITTCKTKLYLSDNPVAGLEQDGYKWSFCSASDVANCGTNFTGCWHSGFAFAVGSSTAFDSDGDNDGNAESGVGSGGGADKTGIELSFLVY